MYFLTLFCGFRGVVLSVLWCKIVVISNFAPPKFRKVKPPEIGKVKPPIARVLNLG